MTSKTYSELITLWVKESGYRSRVINTIKNWIIGKCNSRGVIGLAITVYEPLYRVLQICEASELVESQLCAVRLVGYLPSYIQRALLE